jgi:hypothetical protein
MQTTNRQFMARFVAFINTADPRRATELVSPDAVSRSGARRGAFFGGLPRS